MNAFAWALAAFVLLHVGVSATGLRALIVTRTGERVYRVLFSLASIVLLGWLIYAYHDMRLDPFDPLNAPFWYPSAALRYATYVLVCLGLTLAVAGLLTPGPTLVGAEGLINKPEPARGVLRITRHPFLWGVALWAAGHLLANSDRANVMLFGAFGLMALFGARSIDRKGEARDPEAWARFAAVTSNTPFAAIVQGRNKVVLSEMWWRLLAGVAVFALIGYFHRQIFGVAAFS